MAHLEDMRLPVVAREALVDDPSFLRDLVEAVLNRFLDAEITESSPVAFGLSLLLQVRRPVGGHAAMLVTSSSLALGAASSSLLMSR